MNIRRRAVLVAALLAVFVAACGTDEPASLPTPDPTPTPIRISLITLDPKADPEAFLAALPTDEAECAANVAGGRGQLIEVLGHSDTWAYKWGLGIEEIDAIIGCLTVDTALAIFVGQFDRLIGGLSDATVACMMEEVASLAPTALLLTGIQSFNSFDETGKHKSIFCLNAMERTVLETQGAEIFAFPRNGYIDSLECMDSYRDEAGNLVVGTANAYLNAYFLEANATPFADDGYQEYAAHGRITLAAVECGVMTDEDFEGSVVTAAQMACMIKEGHIDRVTYAWMTDPAMAPDPEELAKQQTRYKKVLSTCGVDASQITGDPIDMEPTAGVPALKELDVTLTGEQTACIQSYLSEEEFALMIEAGQQPAELFEVLDACDVSLDVKFQ